MQTFVIVVCVCDRGRGKTDCDSSAESLLKLSISLQFKIEKLLGGQPMLIFASDVWVTIDINPCKFHICR
jgi:hypothetical protein